jgi:membrane-associated phospholipid phosphatase
MWLMGTFYEKILQYDVKAMVLINRKMANPFFDWILPWLRESTFWVPLYIFLIAWGIMNLGRKALWWVLSAFLTIGLSDQVSSGFIKNTVARVRPCRDPEVLPQILLRLEHCSGAFSFTSSHAANHFALAMFIYASLVNTVPSRITGWLFLWAAAIGYAQVYVGVHYPLDVLGGTLVGLVCGWLTSKLYLLKTKHMDS